MESLLDISVQQMQKFLHHFSDKMILIEQTLDDFSTKNNFGLFWFCISIQFCQKLDVKGPLNVPSGILRYF